MARLQQLVEGGHPLGAKAMAELAAGLKSKNPEIKEAAEGIEALIEAGVTPPATTGGILVSGIFAGMTTKDTLAAATTAGLKLWDTLNDSLSATITIKTELKTPPRAGGFAAGTPYVQEAGFYDVGEAGRERVYLPQGAAVESHAQLMAGGSPAGGSAGASPSGPLIGQMIVNGVTHDDVERQIIRAQRRLALGF
jgi:hypothetical protein